ncbi:hypothetical protein HanIR_Chr07g0306551 [Helianthus annuus]|nr:hypothetical protein HanIR_Chr07g0306551 [Helianthus annuus]
MIPLTIFAVLALGISAKNGLNVVKRPRRSSPRFSSLRSSEIFAIACSLTRRASEDDAGLSSTW